MATPSAIRAAHCAAMRTPPSKTNKVSTASTAKMELSPSELDTGSKSWVYTFALPRLSWDAVSRHVAWGNRKAVAERARIPLRHLLQRHALPADGPGGRSAARAAWLRGRLSARADLLRADAHELRLPARGAGAGAPLRARLRRRRGRGDAVRLVRGDAAQAARRRPAGL